MNFEYMKTFPGCLNRGVAESNGKEVLLSIFPAIGFMLGIYMLRTPGALPAEHLASLELALIVGTGTSLLSFLAVLHAICKTGHLCIKLDEIERRVRGG